MRLGAALLSSLLALTASCVAATFDAGSNVVRHRNVDVYDKMRRDADHAVHQHAKRKDDVYGVPGGVWPTVVVPPGYTLAAGVLITPIPGLPTPPPQKGPATATTSPGAMVTSAADPAQWDKQVEEACMNGIMNMKGKATNDVGLAVCYNIPYLDQTNGTFEADVRFFNISAPRNAWTGLTTLNMTIKVFYPKARIGKTDGKLPVKRQAATQTVAAQTTGAAAIAGQQGEMPNGIMMPIEVTVRKYIGQINEDAFAPGMNLTALQALLVPQISIQATDPKTKQPMNTTISSSETAFVAGIFSRAAAVVTDPQLLVSNPASEIAAAQAGVATPYAIPGMHLQVAPVGLIVTCVWTLIFLGVVGAGTLGRAHHREQYRRALRADGEESIRRF